MISDQFSLAVALEDLHRKIPDPSFGEVVRAMPADEDDALADLIEADGRMRLRLGRPVELDRYLNAVSDLRDRMAPLDAAIDMTLRGMARQGNADEQSVEALIDRHPEIADPIRDAAALNDAIWSTTRLGRHLEKRPVKALPCDFGPALDDGRPRYELRELLGEGAFGQVYLAVDRQLSDEGHPAHVAIKVRVGQDRSTWERRRLAEEATKARRIDHPNVVRVLDRGVSDENEDFIVYEYVGGGDLIRCVRRTGGLTVREAVAMTARIARGVHAAHMAGLVHCDLKPNNVVLTPEGEPKVADFGIAIRTNEGDHAPAVGANGSDEPMGTLAFMSPEQFRMEAGALTIPSDVYALGGVLFWLLTGEFPNGADPESIRRTHDLVEGRRTAPRLDALIDDADADLDAICRRAMAVEPPDRYPSASMLAHDLDRWLRREPIEWTQPTATHRLWLWIRRKPGLAGALAFIVMLAAASGVTGWRLSVESARRTAETKFRLQYKQNLSEAIERLRGIEGFEHEVLPQIWVLEWIFEPRMLPLEDRWFDHWNLRLETVGSLAERAEREDRQSEFESMLWATAHGFWLARADAYVEAEAVLAPNNARWRAILPGGDPWLRRVAGLEACATVGRLAAADGDVTVERLEELADILLEAKIVLMRDEKEGPLHRLVVDSLRTLYGPGMLDDANRLDAEPEITDD